MAKFRKKPVVIEAIRWTGDNLREIIDFTGLHPSANKWSWEEYEVVVRDQGLKIFTLEGGLMATVGDWIIKGVKAEFYPCKPDIFEATYEEVFGVLPSAYKPKEETDAEKLERLSHKSEWTEDERRWFAHYTR